MKQLNLKLLKKIIVSLFIFLILLIPIGIFNIKRDIYLNKNIINKHKYVIILGAGLKNNQPKEVLKERLDFALEYYKKYPQTIFIVSGGKGKDEKISESEAMKEYLIKKYIPEKNILEENKSTSTLENLKFSKEKIPNENNIGVVSSDFHLYRTKYLGNKINMKIEGLYAKTPIKGAIKFYIRESIALIYYHIKYII